MGQKRRDTLSIDKDSWSLRNYSLDWRSNVTLGSARGQEVRPDSRGPAVQRAALKVGYLAHGPRVYLPISGRGRAALHYDKTAEEDERRELHRRFQAEGLDSRLLPDATKLVHVWRWLMDAETNCTSLRYQMDKLHRQQAADMQDLERYVDQVHSLLEEKVSRVQQENHTLRQELEPARDARLLLIHEGLSELAHATLAEQMAFLLAERARYKEQLEIEQKRRRSIEKNRKIAANEATQHQQQSSRSQSDDSEGGNSKSEANERIAKLEEELRIAKTQVQQLVSYIQNPENKKDESHKTWVDNILVDHQQSDWSDSEVTKLAEVQDENRDLRDKVSFLEKTNRQLELDNETLAYKLSEALAQYDDLENELRLERMRPQGGASRQDSPSKSRFNYQKNTLDNRISMQKQDAMLVDQLRKAQHEVASLQSQLTATGRQLQLLMVRGHERKARHQERIQKLRDVLERETQHAEERERELVRTQTHLRREVEQRLRLEMDCKTLQEDKRQLLERLVDKDEEIIRLAQMLNGVQRTQVTLDRKSDYSTDSVSEKNMESEELKE